MGESSTVVTAAAPMMVSLVTCSITYWVCGELDLVREIDGRVFEHDVLSWDSLELGAWLGAWLYLFLTSLVSRVTFCCSHCWSGCGLLAYSQFCLHLINWESGCDVEKCCCLVLSKGCHLSFVNSDWGKWLEICELGGYGVSVLSAHWR